MRPAVAGLAVGFVACAIVHVGPPPRTDASSEVALFAMGGGEGPRTPEYSVEVFSDGLAIFKGNPWVRGAGEHWTRLSPRVDVTPLSGGGAFHVDSYTLCVPGFDFCHRYDGLSATDEVEQFERDLLRLTGFEHLALAVAGTSWERVPKELRPPRRRP